MNIILWLEELQPPLINKAINVLAKTYSALEFVGAIPSETMPFTNDKRAAFFINGKPIPVLFDENSIAALNYDIVLVGGNNNVSMPAILERAKKLNVDANKIVLDRTVCVPGFTLEKYQRLRRSQLSILANNCWGDFDSKLKLVRMMWQEELKFNYPVFRIKDVHLMMNHYNDVDVARAKWKARCRRINWNNLFVFMYTAKPELLEEFDKLPFERKACFVPFETDLPSGFYVEPKFVRGDPFWRVINGIAQNDIACFDLWDLLLDGKKTPL